MTLGVVGRANQRSTFYKIKTLFHADFLVHLEGVGVHVFRDLEVLFRGLQILADSQYIAAVSDQVVHDFKYFFFGFAEADHDARFRALAVVLGALNLIQ